MGSDVFLLAHLNKKMTTGISKVYVFFIIDHVIKRSLNVLHHRNARTHNVMNHICGFILSRFIHFIPILNDI